MKGKFINHNCIKAGISYAPKSTDILVILDRQVATPNYFYFPLNEWIWQGGE